MSYKMCTVCKERRGKLIKGICRRCEIIKRSRRVEPKIPISVCPRICPICKEERTVWIKDVCRRCEMKMRSGRFSMCRVNIKIFGEAQWRYPIDFEKLDETESTFNWSEDVNKRIRARERNTVSEFGAKGAESVLKKHEKRYPIDHNELFRAMKVAKVTKKAFSKIVGKDCTELFNMSRKTVLKKTRDMIIQVLYNECIITEDYGDA